jgi:hypothetical protein
MNDGYYNIIVYCVNSFGIRHIFVLCGRGIYPLTLTKKYTLTVSGNKILTGMFGFKNVEVVTLYEEPIAHSVVLS